MASQEIEIKRMTKKNADPDKPRKKLTRTRLTQNGKRYDLSRAAARRRLRVKQNERLLKVRT